MAIIGTYQLILALLLDYFEIMLTNHWIYANYSIHMWASVCEPTIWDNQCLREYI